MRARQSLLQEPSSTTQATGQAMFGLSSSYPLVGGPGNRVQAEQGNDLANGGEEHLAKVCRRLELSDSALVAKMTMRVNVPRQ